MWLTRKRQWLGIGIKSELGRGSHLAYHQESNNKVMGKPKTEALLFGPPGAWVPGYFEMKRKAEADMGRPLAPAEFDSMLPRLLEAKGSGLSASGTSVFDPVLAELSYRWFCPPGGRVLDPFAGGSVRGVVAAVLGRRYTGVDLSAAQVEANRVQAVDILGADADRVIWHRGDSTAIATTVDPGPYDFVFSCPPYGDLEEYSDDPADLSAMDHDAFLVAYRAIIEATVGLLAPNAFAAFVVGDYRAPDGSYRGFVPATIDAFERAGCQLYNEAIVVTAVGSLPVRVGRQFAALRKLGKTHQNLLVFVRGDVRAACARLGEVEATVALSSESSEEALDAV